MLSAEEVQKIIDDMQALKNVKVDPKKAAAGDKASKAEARKAQLAKKEAGDKIFVYNQSVDLNNHSNNDSKPYYVATVKKYDGSNVTCDLHESESKDCRVAELKKAGFQAAPENTVEYSKMSEAGINDMVDIDELNPATLLYNMSQMYKRYDIYVYVGPILLVMNPFKALPALATPELKAQYMEITTCEHPLKLRKELNPHTWAVSAMAYRTLKDTRARQAIVISGESGAGKTESAKVAMNFLTDLGKQGDAKSDVGDIGTKILACNPVLEGFGNAKTVRNDNSSRFGKYTLMYFALQKDEIFGARIKNYLLEKSRVISVAANERGYHSFYFMLRGMTDEQLKPLFMTDAKGKRLEWKNFNYLKNGGDLSEKHDVAGWNEMLETIQKLGFSEPQQDAIWRCCAAVLLLGQVDYDKNSFKDVDNNTVGKLANPDIATKIAKLLGIKNEAFLAKIMVQARSIAGKEVLWKANSLKKSTDNKDALAKQLFNNMFDWLVIMMNRTIEPENLADPSFADQAKTIGLLDIFGFENFAFNNYEQLCINYVNEKLHKLYIAAIFEAECVELKEEGLGHMVDSIQYPDLKVLDILRLLDFKMGGSKYAGIAFAVKPTAGIFTLTDDFCTQVLSGREVKYEDVAAQFDVNHGKNTKIYLHNKKTRCGFKIYHSAQNVDYDMKEFVQRNVDCIPAEYEDLMCKETDEYVQCIYQMVVSLDAVGATSGKKLKTIWGKFDLQMNDLMDELAEPKLQMGEEKQKKIPENAEDCKLHFVRCIKPRPKPLSATDNPGMFVHSMTLQQITYMGVMESVALKQKNFPFRKKFEEFYAEYELLSPRYAQKRYYQMDKGAEDFQSMASAIVTESMQGCGKDYYAIGTTKILMMPEARTVIDECIRKASEKRDQKAAILKRAYSLLIAPQVHAKKSQALLGVQCRYKLKYFKKQKMWANMFKANFEKAIIEFKAEKRKTFEQKAGAAMCKVIQTHVFRNKLAKAIKARQSFVDGAYITAYINKLRKHLISHMLSRRIVSTAFNQAREKIDGKSAWEVQRAFRGYLARNKGDRIQWVKDSIAQKENLRLHVSAKKIQKRLRGLVVRRKIHCFNMAAATIQSFFRMKIHRDVFLMIKKNVLVLQRGVRRFLARRDMIKERMKEYLMQEFQIMNNVRDMENVQLDNSNPDLIKNHTPYTLKKICLFNRVADLHVISDLQEMHGTPWAGQWMQLYKEGMENDAPIMKLTVGTSHSLACNGRGKTYAWGWNDNGQCAKDTNICDEVIIKNQAKAALVQFKLPVNVQDQQATVKCRQMLATEDRNLILLQDTHELIAWGGNEKGQLGLGHYTDVSQPTKLDFFTKQGLQVNSISAGGNLTLATTKDGLAFAWPFVKSGQKYSIPVQMPFHSKITISRVSCGYNFGFFISSQGLVYAVGKDNSDGQLGLGHRYPNDIPEIVACFKDVGERIDSIECGFRHSVARSTLGKVYTWGWNGHGQLGNGNFDSELSPRMLLVDRMHVKREKAIQIAAGYSHTVVMTDQNRDLYWMGTSGSLQKQNTPIAFDLNEKLPGLFKEKNSVVYSMGQQVEFAVVKIDCTWSKSLSLTNLTIVDLRPINKEHKYTKIASVLTQLSNKWDQREVMPPYMDVHSGLFSSTIMRKPAPPNTSTKKPATGGQMGATLTPGKFTATKRS